MCNQLELAGVLLSKADSLNCTIEVEGKSRVASLGTELNLSSLTAEQIINFFLASTILVFGVLFFSVKKKNIDIKGDSKLSSSNVFHYVLTCEN